MIRTSRITENPGSFHGRDCFTTVGRKYSTTVVALAVTQLEHASRHTNASSSTSTIPPSLFSERVKYLHDYARLATSNPLCAITLTVVMFSIAGIPPLAGFYSKTFLIFAAIGSANYVLSIVAIAMSVISAFYYIRIVKIMYFEPTMLQTARRVERSQSAEYSSLRLDSHKIASLDSGDTNSLLVQNKARKPETTTENKSIEKGEKQIRVLPFSLKKEFAYTMLSFTRISKQVSLVCALCFCFLLFFSMHPKPIFLLTQKALLLLTLL